MTMNQKVKGFSNTLEHRPEHLWSKSSVKIGQSHRRSSEVKRSNWSFLVLGVAMHVLGQIFLLQRARNMTIKHFLLNTFYAPPVINALRKLNNYLIISYDALQNCSVIVEHSFIVMTDVSTYITLQ